ncbi:hypothetical protein [Nostoc sp.]|uniref:hypothetical protein n=1 Tax=Nostoc sp. TaxID=1180 RepID=UPI002FF4B58E
MTNASLSEKTVEILNNNKATCLFTSRRWFGHEGVIDWFSKEEIVNFLKSLGESHFLGKGFYPKGVTGKKPPTLIFQGYEINYVYPVPVGTEINLENWTTVRERADEYLLAQGKGYKIVQGSRCTVSTNLETREMTVLYVEVEGLNG